jgi:zinc protease
MTIDRSIAPGFKTISKVEIIKAEPLKLDNGIDLFSINAGSQEITRLEFIFKAGMYHQPATLIASTTNSLLETGTKTYSANQISDGIDFYGSFIELGVGQDYAFITVYSLNKYLAETLHFVEEVIKNPVFSEEEFRIFINNKKQKFQINSQKVSIIARRKFSELLFGSEHPYGVDVKEGDFERVNLGEIQAFYEKYYQSGNCTIMASGCLPENLTSVLNRFFGQIQWGKDPQNIANPALPVRTTVNRNHYYERNDALQSAIRIGRILFNKTNPDYYHFQVLNTILGGYFGSRLMANIREDKGFTYGIGSGVMSLVHTGYFFISTEVGTDVTNQALDETYKEIKILREELVGDQELETVKNYILGQILRSVDGPFALADKYKAIWEFGLDYSYFENYFKAIQNVTPSQIRDMANKYLKQEDLIECVVGKKN